jgi:hypothetical protein
MKRLLPLTLTALAFLTVAAVADLSVKDGGGTTRVIKNFVCETTKLCNATVLIKSDGTEIGTSSAEVFVGGRGTAGSAAGGVLTVQGSASGTAVPVSIASVPSHAVTNAGTFATQAAVTAASGSYSSGAFASGSMVDLLTLVGSKNAGTGAASSLLAGGIYNSTPLTLTNTQQSSLQLDANGYLKVNTAAGAAAGGTSSAFAAAFPATGTAAGMSQGGNMVAMTGTSGNLNVQCANCSGSGVSTVDAAAFTASTSLFAGTGGFFQTTATANPLTNGQQGMWQMTANRAGFVNLRDTAGVAIGTSAAEVFVGGRGTAGSAAGGVLTVQGSASGTAVPVSLASVPSHAVTNAGTFATQAAVTAASGSYSSGAFASGSYASGAFAAGSMVDLLTMRGTVAAGTAAANSILTSCIYNSTPITLTNGQGSAVQCSANGYPTVVVSNTNANGQAALASSSPVAIAKNSGTGSTVAGAAIGAAGTASAEVVTVQGVASMTPVQISQATASNLNAAVVGTGTAGSAAGGVLTVQGVASMTPFLANPGTAANWGVGSTAAAVPASANYIGFNSGGNLTAPAVATPMPVRQSDGTNVGSLDPCQSEVKSTLPITLATAAVKVIAVGVSAKKIYVCQLYLNNNAADSVAIFEATTGTTCATSPIAVVGAGTSVATAATGNNWAANGGLSQGNGASQVLATTVNNNDLCVAQSAATQLTGSITYVTR